MACRSAFPSWRAPVPTPCCSLLRGRWGRSVATWNKQAADSACSLPRLRGREGEEEFVLRPCPLPVPPPQAGEGTVWRGPSSLQMLRPRSGRSLNSMRIKHGLIRRELAAHRRQFSFRSEEHTSELQSHSDLVCRLLL